MSAANQWTSKTPRARLRVLGKKAQALLDAVDKAESDVLVAIHEMKTEGLTDAAVAGMFGMSASGVKPKARAGEALAVERSRRGKVISEPDE